MELLFVILPYVAALLTLFGWAAWRGREPAAIWWGAAAVALCASAFVSASGLREALQMAPDSPLGTAGAWLLYRGCAEFVGTPAKRWAAVLATLGVVGWLLFDAAGWSDAARYLGPPIESGLCLAAAALVLRASATPIQRLFASGIGLVAVAALLDPVLRTTSVGASSPAVFVWIAAGFPTALFGACALLERGTLRATEKLREREHQLAEAQRIAHVGSWSFNPDNGELEWSDEKFRIHGYEPGSIEPWDAVRAGIPAQTDRDTVWSSAAQAIRENRDIQSEISFTNAAGEPARVRDYSVLVTGADGRRRVLGVTHDVTEQVRAEEELDRHRAHLEELVGERTAQLEASTRMLRRSERLAALGTLAAGIAHQINNPVGSILASAQLARRLEGTPEGPQAAMEALRNIERESHRCGEIAHGVLRFARDQETEKQVQSLAPVLERAVDSTRSYAASRGAVIHYDEPAAELCVAISAIDIEQAVVNLVRNAIEAKEEGAAVRLSCTEKDGRVVILVDDDGCGIPRSQLEHVFDPFFTHGKDGGTGLGLSVAHGIATEHGGSLAIESRENFGTRVGLSLPIAA